MPAIPEELEIAIRPINQYLFDHTGVLGPAIRPTSRVKLEFRFFKPFTSNEDFIYRGACILIPTLSFSVLALESLVLALGYLAKSLCYDLPRLMYSEFTTSLSYTSGAVVLSAAFVLLALISPIANFVDWIGAGIKESFFPEDDLEMMNYDTQERISLNCATPTR